MSGKVDLNSFTVFERHEQKMRGCDPEIVKAYRAAQKRKRRIEHEKAESMSRYTEQQTASVYSHEAQAILWALSRLSYTARGLTTSDIVSKVQCGEELHFYYTKLCEVRT